MAYVIADLGLIGVVTFVLAITGWHLDRSWMFVLVGCFVFGVADTAYSTPRPQRPTRRARSWTQAGSPALR